MRDDIEPGDEFEELVYTLILEKKIPELVEGDIFQSDMRGLGNFVRPDLVHFFQSEENEITMVPYDIKQSRRAIKPQQASPLTLGILDVNQNEPFHKRLMENLEKYGWQNKDYIFKEGSMIIKRLDQEYDLGDKLTYKREIVDSRSLEKVKRFKRNIGFYTIDTIIIENYSEKDLKMKELEKILSQIDWFKLKAPENVEIIYSASKKICKEQRSKEIFVTKRRLYVKTDICPYILVPKEYIKE